MVERFMKIGGTDGKNAKGIRTDLEGNLKVQSTDAFRVFDEETVVGNSTITSEVISINGEFTLAIKMHSYATYNVSVQYLNADGTVFDTEILGEVASSSEARFDFTPKYPYYNFVINSTYESNRDVWATLVKKRGEPLYKWLDIEESSVLDVWNGEEVAENGSTTSDLINSAGNPIQIGFRWSHPKNMFMRLDIQYFTETGFLIGEDKNIASFKNTNGIIEQIIEFTPRFNLFKIVAHNDSDTLRSIHLTISRIKESKTFRRKVSVQPREMRSSEQNHTHLVIPPNAYGISLYLIVHDFTPDVGATVRLRARPTIKLLGGNSNGNHYVGGWISEEVPLDGKKPFNNIQMHIMPESLYLAEYPYSETEMGSTLDIKTCPVKLTSDQLLVSVFLDGDFAENQGVDYEIVGYWHV